MIIKLALLTCGFYLAVALLMEATLLFVAHWKGEAGLFGTRWGWIILFGLVWLLSFRLAWHFVIPPSGRPNS